MQDECIWGCKVNAQDCRSFCPCMLECRGRLIASHLLRYLGQRFLPAGHFSQSGRFDRLKEVAMEMAFLLKCVGMQ